MRGGGREEEAEAQMDGRNQDIARSEAGGAAWERSAL